LTDYSASKFGALGLHEALAAENYAHGYGHYQNCIYSTLVCPFYTNTGMFNGVSTGYVRARARTRPPAHSSRFIPILEADYVVTRIMQAILTNTPRLCLPLTAYLFPIVKS
jgi:all-trans-retinol dehydrogenase (NAD+)